MSAEEYQEYEEHGSIEHGSRGHAGLPTVMSFVDVCHATAGGWRLAAN